MNALSSVCKTPCVKCLFALLIKCVLKYPWPRCLISTERGLAAKNTTYHACWNSSILICLIFPFSAVLKVRYLHTRPAFKLQHKAVKSRKFGLREKCLCIVLQVQEETSITMCLWLLCCWPPWTTLDPLETHSSLSTLWKDRWWQTKGKWF